MSGSDFLRTDTAQAPSSIPWMKVAMATKFRLDFTEECPIKVLPQAVLQKVPHLEYGYRRHVTFRSHAQLLYI